MLSTGPGTPQTGRHLGSPLLSDVQWHLHLLPRFGIGFPCVVCVSKPSAMLAFIPRAISYTDPESIYAPIPHRTPLYLPRPFVLFQRPIWSGLFPSLSLNILIVFSNSASSTTQRLVSLDVLY